MPFPSGTSIQINLVIPRFPVVAANPPVILCTEPDMHHMFFVKKKKKKAVVILVLHFSFCLFLMQAAHPHQYLSQDHCEKSVKQNKIAKCS